jgi:hypothetical protein
MHADLEKGLGRGGPVISALEDVVRTHDGPVRGSALFEVVIDGAGRADVHLVSADHEQEAWSQLSGAMSAAVAEQHVRVPSSARGIRMAIRLETRVQLPDGSDPASLGTFVRPTGFQLAPGSMVAASAPSVNAGVNGKVCSAALHVGIDGVAILGGCDPSAINAVPVRVVSGREVDEVLL